MLFYIASALTYIPTNSVQGSVFSTSSPSFFICIYFDDSYSDSCVVVPCFYFYNNFYNIYNFYNNQHCGAVFQMPIGHLYVSLKNVCSRSSVCFFDLLFDVELYELFIYFGYQPFAGHIICKHFLPFSKLSFPFVSVSLCCTKAYTFTQVPFLCLHFYFFCLRRQSIKCCYNLCQSMFCLYFLLRALQFLVFALHLLSILSLSFFMV